MKKLLLSLCVVSLFACSENLQDVSGQKNSDDSSSLSSTQSTQSKSGQSSHDGVYVFDTETYKQVQLDNADSVFKKMKPEDVDRLMQIFRPFKIELTGNQAIASFSHDIIKGELKTLEKNGATSKLFMTPTDEKKKDQTVTLIITGEKMILDPGKKETDKMFFKKVDLN